MYKTLTTSVAAIALMTSAALAESDASAEADAKVNSETSAEMNADATTDGAEGLAQDVEQVGEALAETAEEVGTGIAEGTEQAVEAAENTAEDAASSIEETAEDVTQSAEETAVDGTGSAENTADEATDSNEMATDTAPQDDQNAADENEVTSTGADINADFNGMIVGDIMGRNVITKNGEDVGEIDYVVRQNGGLAGVIGIGGFLGFGEYTVAVPLEEFSMAAGDASLKLSSWTEEELKAQPEFDETGVEGLESNVPLDGSM